MPVNRYCHGIFSLDNTTTRDGCQYIFPIWNAYREIQVIAAEFKNSNFEVNKTSHAFSLLPVDQAHEQNNKIAKGD